MTLEPDPAIDASTLKEIITEPSTKARDLFLGEFGGTIDDLAERLGRVHARFVLVNPRVPQDERSGWTQMFMYAAFHNLVSSAHLLVFGMHLPAGNLMRSWGEAVTFSLLCSSDRIDVYDQLQKDPFNFTVHRAIAYLEREDIAAALDVNSAGLEGFKRITKHYHRHSHASPWALASISLIDVPGGLVLAGEYDPAKKEYYTHELSLRTSACDRMLELIPAVEHNLQQRRS